MTQDCPVTYFGEENVKWLGKKYPIKHRGSLEIIVHRAKHEKSLYPKCHYPLIEFIFAVIGSEATNISNQENLGTHFDEFGEYAGTVEKARIIYKDHFGRYSLPFSKFGMNLYENRDRFLEFLERIGKRK